LEHGFEHSFQVTAVNAAGESDFSEGAYARLQNGEVVGMRAILSGPREITVNWTPYPDANEYYVNYESRKEGHATRLDGEYISGTHYVFDNLECWRDYTIGVSAKTTSRRTMAESDNITIRTTCNPPDLTVKSYSDKLVASWAVDSAYASDTTYMLEWYKSGSSDHTSVSLPIRTSSYTIPATIPAVELRFGSKYYFKIRSINGTSQTPFSEIKAGTLLKQIKPSSARGYVNPGYGMDIYRSDLVLGDPELETYLPCSASIFVRNADGTWPVSENQRIWESDLRPLDMFGMSVSISSDTIVVGAPGKDRDGEVFGIGEQDNDGAVYIFKRNTDGSCPNNEILQVHSPTDAANEIFGKKVAIDDNTIVVAAPYQNNPHSHDGLVYVIERENSVADWPTTTTATLNPDVSQESAEFGSALAIDGDTIVVGSPHFADSDHGFFSSGLAYIFVKTSDGWHVTPTVTLHPSESGQLFKFGYAVAISNDLIAIGSPGVKNTTFGICPSRVELQVGSVYLFKRNADGSWPEHETGIIRPTDCDNDRGFGSSLAIEGNYLLIGNYKTNSGRVYLYTFQDNEWKKQFLFQDPTPSAPYNLFGYVLAISGSTAAISNLNEGV